mmetsp:Transcript_35885/g.70603  ORF Transcript_35885/g.70603 Transcript_35885/m.70603 type:complete len:243 (-) Transcript_35885:74-802(-)
MRFPPSAVILSAAAACLLAPGAAGLALTGRPSRPRRRPSALGASGGGKSAAASARTASFEEAQRIGADLAALLNASCRSDGDPMPAGAVDLLRALVSTTSGARGWFVTLLTDPDYGPVFARPVDATLLSALCDSPETNVELMTMNVAMSTATELTHLSMGNPELAANSRVTAERAGVLALEVMDRMPGLRDSFVALRSAVDGTEEEGDKFWLKFCKKWGYGPEQRDAIRVRVDELLEESGRT